MNQYPVFFDYDEKSKSAVVWGSKEVQLVELVALPLFLYVGPILKAVIKHYCPIELLLQNGRGDKRNQIFNKSMDQINNLPF